MNKKILTLIGGCVLIAGLTTAVILVSRKNAAEEAASSAAEASESAANEVDLVLSDRDMNQVVSIDVKNADDHYTIVRLQEADETAGTSAVFGIQGWEHVPTNTSLVMTLANNVASLTASSQVAEDCDNLDKYGLGSSAITAEMTFDDGTSFSYRIGNAVAGGENTYFSVEGSSTVYAVPVSKVANYSHTAKDFLSKTILEKPADEEMPTITGITIDRTDLKSPILLKRNEKSGDQEMVAPISAYLSLERSDGVVNGMFGLLASSVLEIEPDNAALATYGLDEPFATAVMTCAEAPSYTLHIGNRYTENGTAYYPVLLEGADAIYQVAESSCPWATVTPTDLASRLVLTTYVWDIAELTVTGKDRETMEFRNAGTDKDTADISCNGADCDNERFRLFYTFLLATAAESVADEDTQPVGEAEATLTLRTHDGSTNKHIEFYRQDAFTCLMVVNDVPSFTCRASYLDAFLENMDRFDTSEDFILTWS